MSWVLILSSNVSGRIPAVIGGYETQEAAEVAGDLGTWFADYDETGCSYQQTPFFTVYMVIPGAAAAAPGASATHSRVERLDHSGFDPFGTAVGRCNELRRITTRYPEKRAAADDNPFGRAYRDMIEAGVLKP
jgi:hypothetical protein